MMSSDRIPLPQPLDSESASRVESQRPTAGTEGYAAMLLDVNTSELQLAEETERDDARETSEQGPVDAIGIRAFKMLELLRSQSHEHKSASRDAKSLEQAEPSITTVCEIFLFFLPLPC